MPSDPYPRQIANWWLGETLGAGFSGAIFKATSIHTGQVVALKLQPKDVDCPTNLYERYFYPALQGGVGMPTLWGEGKWGKWDYLAIDLLGASLDSLYRKSGKAVMDLRSVCCIAMQVIKRMEFMHTRGVLHRDIQLGNVVIGLPPNEKTLYMIDFGFSKFYIDPHTKRHIPDSKVKRDFIGNYWFTSVNVHCRGKVPSRRDDMEAVALMLIHLLTPGGLSWTRNGVPKTDAAHERLMREKRDARPEDLCRGLPAEFEEFLRYCRRLKFMDRPDYTRWIDEFRTLAVDSGFPSSSAFVWPPPDPKPTTVQVFSPARRSGPMDAGNVQGILNGLAQLRLGDRQVLGERPELANRAPAANANANRPVPAQQASDDAIVISSDEENAGTRAPAAVRLPKAVHLAKLARTVSEATDNTALARAVAEFVQVLQDSRSRMLTKEGFAVLDALYKQLADPLVYVQPLRTSKPRNGSAETVEQAPESRHAKMSKLFTLRRSAMTATSNKALAQLVAEFGSVINRSSGRTVTKDAFCFLETLASRLRVLS